MRLPTIRKILAVLLAALLLAAFAGCGAQEQSDDSLQKVLDAGKFVLGLDTEFPPMGFVDENGEIVGFDIDMAKEVCSRLGAQLVLQGINWDEKEKILDRGDIDCIWNGLSVTPARQEALCLSEPYMKNEFIFVLPGESPVKKLDDLEGKLVGVQTGSTAEETLMASDLYAKIRVRLFEDNVDLLETLAKGEMDAALVDSVVAYYFVNESEKPFLILSDSFGEDDYAIGFRKEDRALRDKVQEILGEMRADGTLARIAVQWFGSDITTVR